MIPSLGADGPAPHPDRRPTGISSVAAVAAAFVAGAASATGPIQLAPLLGLGAGAAAILGGEFARRRGARRLGGITGVAGVVLATVAIAGSFALAPPLPTLAGIGLLQIGVLALALALVPLRRSLVRPLAVAGLTAVYLGVVLNGLVGDASVLRLAGAIAALGVSWDATVRAIRLGDRLAPTASSAVVEGFGAAVSSAIGFVGVAVAVAASSVTLSEPPLPSVVALLVAVLVALLLLTVDRFEGLDSDAN